MPIFKTSKGLLYFAHVPRTGGSSVEDYLLRRLGNAAFLNRGYLQPPKSMRWSETSPQHILAIDFEKLFPGSFIDHKFSVVRHPISRVVSVYKWLLSTGKHSGRSFDEWLENALIRSQQNPWYLDGHLNCQTDFVPPKARVFRLEEGLNNVARYIDKILDEEPSAYKFEVSHKSRINIEQISFKSQRLIEIHYAEDYEKFKYKVRATYPIAPTQTLKFLIFTPSNSIFAYNWGETAFGLQLAKALILEGAEAKVVSRNQWCEPHDRNSIAIALRGPYELPSTKFNLRILWALSHFSKISQDEIRSYDYILSSAKEFPFDETFHHNGKSLYFPQCTGFSARVGDFDKRQSDGGLLFVGNGKLTPQEAQRLANGDHSVLRPALKLALQAGLKCSIFGRFNNVKLKGHVSNSISYRLLERLYGSAGINLNDHTEEQLHFSAFNNRVFDILASGRPLLSNMPKKSDMIDNFLTPSNVFDSSDTPSSFTQKCRDLLQNNPLELKEISEEIINRHHFRNRARSIIRLVQDKDPGKLHDTI